VSWNEKFINLAEHISTWSKDPSTKIGVVAINPDTKNILSTGYNGFARGISDTEKRYRERETKYKYIVHGEQNCIYNATRNGIKLQGSYMYVYGLPICHQCASAIAQVGVDTIFFKNCDPESETRWSESSELGYDIMKETGITINKL